MNAANTDIFISYRRIDGRDIARTIQLALQKRGYENVFFDYSSMRNGAFNMQIYTAIEKCKDFLLVLSPQSMQRCSNEGDWVAIEIEQAISMGCNIIPIAINEPFTSWPDDFPRKLNFLKRQQMLVLRTDDYFESSIEKLVGWLETLPIQPTKETKKDCYSLKIIVDETCELFVNNERVKKIKKGNSFTISPIERATKYKLTLKSLANIKDIIEKDYIFPDICTNTDQMEISFSQMREQKKRILQDEKNKRDKAKQQRYEQKGFLKNAVMEYDHHSYYEYLLSEGMLPVSKNGKIGFLNDSALEAVPCIFDNVSTFHNGYATVLKNDRWYLIDKIGQIISTVSSDNPCILMPGALYFAASQKGKYNIFPVQHSDTEIPTFPYEDICFIDGYTNLFWAKQNSVWKIIAIDKKTTHFALAVKDIDSSNVFLPFFYSKGIDAIRTLSLPIKIQHPVTGRWGYLNSKLNLSVPFTDEISHESCDIPNLDIICCNNKMGVVNTETGEIVLPIIYTNVRQIYQYYDYPYFRVGEGCVPYIYHIGKDGRKSNNWHIAYGGLQGVCDLSGKFIIPYIYQWIEYFMDIEKQSFFVAYKLSCFHIYEKKGYDNEYYNHPKFDKCTSEIHIYTAEGKLIHKGKYFECYDNVTSILRKYNEKY